MRWTFRVSNKGPGQRTLTFTTGQEGEVVLRHDGTEAYRWSRDKLFAQVVTEHQLAPGETWMFTLDDTLDVEPDGYELVASVAARPPPPTVRGAVAVESGA